MTPFSFLGQNLSPNTPVCGFDDEGDLRKDFLYNATLAHRFWLLWMKSCVSSLQGRNKWRTVRPNLVPSQLVLVGDAEDLAHKGAYRLGRFHSLHPQIRRGKEIVRRATAAVLAQKSTAADPDKIEYIYGICQKSLPVNIGFDNYFLSVFSTVL